MRMRNRVRMRRSVMRMGESVLMLMSMMPHKRIRNNQNRACNHNDQGNNVHPRQLFPQKNKRWVESNFNLSARDLAKLIYNLCDSVTI